MREEKKIKMNFLYERFLTLEMDYERVKYLFNKKAQENLKQQPLTSVFSDKIVKFLNFIEFIICFSAYI